MCFVRTDCGGDFNNMLIITVQLDATWTSPAATFTMAKISAESLSSVADGGSSSSAFSRTGIIPHMSVSVCTFFRFPMGVSRRRRCQPVPALQGPCSAWQAFLFAPIAAGRHACLARVGSHPCPPRACRRSMTLELRPASRVLLEGF